MAPGRSFSSASSGHLIRVVLQEDVAALVGTGLPVPVSNGMELRGSAAHLAFALVRQLHVLVIVCLGIHLVLLAHMCR